MWKKGANRPRRSHKWVLWCRPRELHVGYHLSSICIKNIGNRPVVVWAKSNYEEILSPPWPGTAHILPASCCSGNWIVNGDRELLPFPAGWSFHKRMREVWVANLVALRLDHKWGRNNAVIPSRGNIPVLHFTIQHHQNVINISYLELGENMCLHIMPCFIHGTLLYYLLSISWTLLW